MKYGISITVLVLALLCAGVGISSAAEEVQQQTYVSKTIVDVPWGDKPEEFGLSKGPERFGARTFALDKKGDIYIYDNVKGYIKKFDKGGVFQSNIGPVTLGPSIAVGDNDHVFVIRGNAVDEYLTNGKLLKTHFSPVGYGDGIKFDKWGTLYVNNGGMFYEIGREVNGQFFALSREEQEASMKEGVPSNNKDKRLRAKIRGKRLTILETLDNGGNILKEVPMGTPESSARMRVLGQDKFGYIYFQAIFYDSRGAHLEIRKYDEGGNHITTVNPEISVFTEAYKRIEVDEDGSIYVLSTTPKSVQIIKWEQK